MKVALALCQSAALRSWHQVNMPSEKVLLLFSTVACVLTERRMRRVVCSVWAKKLLKKQKEYSHIDLFKELKFLPKGLHNY